MLGGGESRCRVCANKRLVRRKVEFYSAMFEHDWCRDLFVALSTWPGIRVQAPNIGKRMDSYARFFSELDRTLSVVGDLTGERLLELFGSEGLRRNQVPVSFLSVSASMGISPSSSMEILVPPEKKAVAAERLHVKRLIDENSGAPWGADLVAYEKYLRAGRGGRQPLSERTIQLYLHAGAELMRHAGVMARELKARDLRSLIGKRPGLAASILPFNGYLRREVGVDIANPNLRRTKPAVREKRLLTGVGRAMERLRTTTKFEEGRALIAFLMAKLYGIPIRAILRTRKADVAVRDGRVVLKVGGDELVAEGELNELVLAWVGPMVIGHSMNPYLFEGRGMRQSLDAGSVRYWAA